MSMRSIIMLFAEREQVIAGLTSESLAANVVQATKELTYPDEGKLRTLFALNMDVIDGCGVPTPFQGRTCLAFEILQDGNVKPIQCNQLALGNVCASEVIAMARKLCERS